MAGNLTIGGFRLSGWELPENINFGGEQILAEHVLIGGKRFWDAMGAKHDAIAWKARFRGPTALNRAQALDEMRIAGSQIEISVFNVAKTVVIRKFKFTVKQFYEIDYDITVEVVTDDGAGSLGGLAGALDGLVNADMLSALNASAAAPQSISDAIAPLDLAVEASTGLASATNAELLAFQNVAISTSQAVQSIADSAEAGISTIDGMASGSDPDNMIAYLNSQSTNITTESQALDVLPYVNRIELNVLGAGN